MANPGIEVSWKEMVFKNIQGLKKHFQLSYVDVKQNGQTKSMVYFEEGQQNRLDREQINRKRSNIEEVFTQINEEFINDMITNEADLKNKKQKYMLLSETNKENRFTSPETETIHETLYRESEIKTEHMKEL